MKLKSFLFLSFILFTISCASAQKIGRWEKLGERTVNYRQDRDVINCTHKGTFNSLKLGVKGAPVDFDNITVEFLNGAKQELKIRQFIKAGGETRVIDLRGNNRIIKRITLHYNSIKAGGHHRKKARVEVWGRK